MIFDEGGFSMGHNYVHLYSKEVVFHEGAWSLKRGTIILQQPLELCIMMLVPCELHLTSSCSKTTMSQS